MAAELQDVAYGFVGALLLHHDGHMPDIGHIAHVEHMPRSDLAEERLQYCHQAGQPLSNDFQTTPGAWTR